MVYKMPKRIQNTTLRDCIYMDKENETIRINRQRTPEYRQETRLL